MPVLRRNASLLCALALALTLAQASVPGAGEALAARPPFTDKNAALKAPPDTSRLAPDEVAPFLAALTDEQARQVLRERLQAEALARVKDSGQERGDAVRGPFERLETRLRAFLERMAGIADQASRELADREALLSALSGGRGRAGIEEALWRLSLMALGGFAAYALARRASARLERRLPGRLAPLPMGRLWAMAAGALLRLMAVAAQTGVSFALYVALTPDPGPVRAMGMVLVVTLAVFLLVRLGAQVLLSPESALLRPFPLSDATARTVYRWLLAVACADFLAALASFTLLNVTGAKALAVLVYSLAGVLSGLLLAAMVLANRRRVAQALVGDAPQGTEETLRTATLRNWHVPASAYALSMGLAWSIASLAEGATILSLLLSLFLIPACIGADLWIGRLLAVASGEDREIIPIHAGERPGQEEQQAGDAARGGKTFRDYVPLIRKSLRAALVVFPLFAMLKMWGVEIPLGWLFARNILSVLLVAVGALVFWEIVRIRIDRRLREEAFLPGEEMEEGGGAGGSRSATLLLLLRKFLLCVIVVMGALVALSSLGVDIAPLIAGAGVVGLAIGFGAQTLVKDIISGVFFLVDDAFRVGDYVEAGTAKGTVEQISLRSMKLRHPRGMVFTIPYGGLKILQNYSRDYIISKLDFRVRFDADIEKIRKIIKRINKQLLADEDIRKGMLSDIKSMGVRKMEDSAMILRIKFKTVPGHQFLVEKELYRRVQEAFRENGIEFAHRNVTVYLPPEVQPASPLARAAAAGAAAEALAREEEERALLAARSKPAPE